MMGTMQVSPPPLRQTNLRKGLVLEYFTLGWNVLEAIVGLVAGTLAGSVALVGFALDSIAEATSGSILIWRLRIEQSGKTERRGGRAASNSIGSGGLSGSSCLRGRSSGL